MVDVQAVPGGNRTDPVQLLGADLARQQGDDMTGLALAADPLPIVVFGDRGEAHLLIEFIGGEQQILEHRLRAAIVRNLDEDAERQGVVDHRLADIENVHPALSQHAGDGSSESGAVFAGDIDQDDFAQDAPSRAND